MEIETIVSRLVELYHAAKAIPPEPGKRRDWAANVVDLKIPAPSRIDCVLDRRSGLEYAAWCIGETLAATGGRNLMDQVYEVFEKHVDAKGSAWLDHRWSGCGGGWYA